MKGFFFDENLPANIRIKSSFPITHASALGKSPTDSQIWEYAKQHDLVIVTKDVDFSDRSMTDISPARVVHLRMGNIRKREFLAFLERVWPQIEALAAGHRLVNLYLDRIEVID